MDLPSEMDLLDLNGFNESLPYLAYIACHADNS